MPLLLCNDLCLAALAAARLLSQVPMIGIDVMLGFNFSEFEPSQASAVAQTAAAAARRREKLTFATISVWFVSF